MSYLYRVFAGKEIEAHSARTGCAKKILSEIRWIYDLAVVQTLATTSGSQTIAITLSETIRTMLARLRIASKSTSSPTEVNNISRE